MLQGGNIQKKKFV